MNRGDVDSFFADGCGRCDHYKTPRCKVHSWTEPLSLLREVLLGAGLKEQLKWGSPCYTDGGRNVVMLVAFKDYCGLSFFKGVLLTDTTGALRAPGPNSRAARYLAFTSADQVRERRELAGRFVREAIEVERSGRKVSFNKSVEPMPEELQSVLDADPAVKTAFEALTPGRRRSYILHVSGAKQARTRETRAGKCVPKILRAKGFNER